MAILETLIAYCQAYAHLVEECRCPVREQYLPDRTTAPAPGEDFVHTTAGEFVLILTSDEVEKLLRE